MFALLVMFWAGLNPLALEPGRNAPNSPLQVRPMDRFRGAILSLLIRPGMSQNQVHDLLGSPEFMSFEISGTVEFYQKTGIQVCWSSPGKIIAPAERIGPEGRAFARVIPWLLLRGLVVPVLAAEYCPPSVVQTVKWIGFGH